MNWGILGYGVIAKDFIESLNVAEGQTLYAIASRSAGNLSELFPEVKGYTSYDELYGDAEIDIIYIATPHNFHFDSVIKSLEHGKHVLCEKPMGISLEQTQIMVETSKKTGCFLMEGMWTRYLPAYRKAREIVDEGMIGEIKLIRSDFCVRKERDDSHRMWNPELAGGSLYDLGVYNIALINDYFGPNPKKVSVDGGIVDTGVDEYIAAQLSYSHGGVAQIYSGLNTLSMWEATLYGEKGWIRIEEFFRTKQIVVHTNNHTQVMPIPMVSTGFYHEILEAERCIKNEWIESPLFSHQSSLDSARLVDILLKKAKASDA